MILKKAKIRAHTKGVPNLKHYMLILQLLGKVGLHWWESFPFQPDHAR